VCGRAGAIAGGCEALTGTGVPDARQHFGNDRALKSTAIMMAKGMSGVEFRLLGPVELATATGPVPIGGVKPRTLLASLLLETGRVVSTERLIDVIWDEDPPDSARAVVQTYVSSLRRAGGAVLAGVLLTRPPGYLARVPPGSLDLDAFGRFVAQGRAAVAADRYEDAVDAFRSAEELWRGPALGGVTSRLLAAEAAKLDELRIGVTEERITAELALGRGTELVAPLSALVGRHPTRERLRGQLMLSLHRAGRTSDALEVYRRGRAALVEELGLEPGPELGALHESILRGDPVLLPGEPPRPRSAMAGRAAAPVAPGRLVPAQLPPDPADFTGRSGEIDQLVGLLTGTARSSMVCVVSGPGGVGKSALAVHVGHRIAAEYPDGQLHVDLRGMSPSPATPAEVLGRFLRALDPDAAALPDSIEERIDRYRTLLFRRRVLVVLDDAANEAQVRPLVPGAPECAVLVTSRSRMPGLAGAHLTDLDMLTVEEATALLAHVAGAHRIDAYPEASAQIVTRCGRLPLAIRIAGARLATRRQWSPALLAARLTDERQRLDELAVGDQQVRASIELSYQSLPGDAQVVLRRLGRLGLPDFAPWVAAALAGVPVTVAERVVEQLVDAHLVDYSFVDGAAQVRYRLHDLIRIYAQERDGELETGDEERAATARVIAGWLGLVERLAKAQPAGVIGYRPRGSTARADLPEVARTATADSRAWLEAEQNALVLTVERAAALDLDALAVELSSALCGSVFLLHNLLDAWGRTHTAALAAARRAGNLQGEAVLLAELGQLRLEQDRSADAREYLSQALAMFRDAGDIRGEVAALAALGLACREQGYLPEAQHFLAQASRACSALGDNSAWGHCARLAGTVYLELGDFAAAAEALEAALAAYQRAGSRRGTGLTHRNLSLLHRARGDLPAAERDALAALAIFEELDDPLMTAYCVRTLAKTRLRMGRSEGPRAELESALATCRSAGDRWGEGMTLRTLGELHLAAGRLDEADRQLTAALAVWDALTTPLLRARTLRDLASVHDARGDMAAGQQVRAEAIAIFRAHRAREFTELTGVPIDNSEKI
jgi:DNA-binding SARP family transcriptional activator/tetratricopeptide (TPR) repeat protein